VYVQSACETYTNFVPTPFVTWPTLIKRGGERFVAQLAELYFFVRLNIAHIKVGNMISAPVMAYYEGIMAEDALNSAMRSLRQDHWMKGCKYKPANKHLAKLRYRFALLVRLILEPV
jgi:hypothetical protein